MFMSIPKPLDKKLLFVLVGAMLNDTFEFISGSTSISSNRTPKCMCPGGKLVIWIFQPGSQKRSVDCDETGESKGNLDRIVVGLGQAVEDLVWSPKDRLQFRELSVLWEAGGENLNQVSNLVLRGGTMAFVGLLRHCNVAVNELSLDRIPEGIGDHVRSQGSSRDDNSFFKLGSETDAESVRGGVPRSVNPHINSNLHRRDCG